MSAHIKSTVFRKQALTVSPSHQEDCFHPCHRSVPTLHWLLYNYNFTFFRALQDTGFNLHVFKIQCSADLHFHQLKVVLNAQLLKLCRGTTYLWLFKFVTTVLAKRIHVYLRVKAAIFYYNFTFR